MCKGKYLLELSDEELKNDMGITSVGHRKNILKGIQNLKKFFKDP